MHKAVFKDDPSLVFEIRQGLEREALRIDSEGKLALSSHAEALGSKLTHPNITTDYSESLLEFITPVHTSTQELLGHLEQIHGFTQKSIGAEYIWPNSMPCTLPEDDKIPLAYYGESNVGKLKTLYRRGLGHRYGRSMQSIAGVHYNFSFSDCFWEYLQKIEKSNESLKTYKSKKYFHIIRNYQRYRWLLIYLFGASAVVDASFLEGKEHNLERLDSETFFSPHGMSLRMGGLGYTSEAQKEIGVCFNQVETYVQSLEEARLKSYLDYEKIGLKDAEGEYKQINTHILQIDNEFYSTIRPKNIAKTRESALMALHERGVEYIELRLLDVDPFHPLGVSAETINFLHLFFIWCLSSDSPRIEQKECDCLDDNFSEVLLKGRDTKTQVWFKDKHVPIREAALNILEEISVNSKEICAVVPSYNIALDTQMRKLDAIEQLPAQKVIDQISGKSFASFSKDTAIENSRQYSLSKEAEQGLVEASELSHKVQRNIEEKDKLTFDDFLVKYFEDIKIKF